MLGCLGLLDVHAEALHILQNHATLPNDVAQCPRWQAELLCQVAAALPFWFTVGYSESPASP